MTFILFRLGVLAWLTMNYISISLDIPMLFSIPFCFGLLFIVSIHIIKSKRYLGLDFKVVNNTDNLRVQTFNLMSLIDVIRELRDMRVLRECCREVLRGWWVLISDRQMDICYSRATFASKTLKIVKIISIFLRMYIMWNFSIHSWLWTLHYLFQCSRIWRQQRILHFFVE